MKHLILIALLCACGKSTPPPKSADDTKVAEPAPPPAADPPPAVDPPPAADPPPTASTGAPASTVRNVVDAFAGLDGKPVELTVTYVNAAMQSKAGVVSWRVNLVDGNKPGQDEPRIICHTTTPMKPFKAMSRVVAKGTVRGTAAAPELADCTIAVAP